MPSTAQAVATRFPPRDLAAIDDLVRAGHYTNRADFLRQAAREKLAEARLERKLDLKPFPPEIQQILEVIRKEGPLWESEEEMLAELRRIRHQVYNEEYGEDP